jgi:hypothetical protein
MEGAVSTDRQQDAGLDRLLRAALKPDAPVSAEACPGADLVTAFTEGDLTARERVELELHMANCSRCQSVLAMMARDAAAEADKQAARVPAWRAWLPAPRLRWLVPASAAAIAIVLFVAVRPELTDVGDQAQPSPGAAPLPEFTVARQLDQAPTAARDSIREEKLSASPTSRQSGESPSPQPAELMSAGGKSDSRRQLVNEAERAVRLQQSPPSRAGQGEGAAGGRPDALQPTIATGIQARAEVATQEAVAPQLPAPATKTGRTDVPAAAHLPAGAAVSSDLAMVSPTQEGQKRAAAMGAAREADNARARDAGQPKGVRTVEVRTVVPAGGLEGLWNEADLVVHARAMSTQATFLEKAPAGQDLVTRGPNLATEFTVLEVFKTHNEMPPAEHVVVTQTGDEGANEPATDREVGWVNIQAGAEYVLFLKRMSPTDQTGWLGVVGQDAGIYRLDGNQVVVGTGVSRGPVPSRADLLARLRQFAGTSRRE